MYHSVLCAGFLCAAALPAFAGSFKPPEGCETFLTVQSRGCTVSNYYICAADPKGDQWRADLDREGVYFLSRIDAETQWVESIDIGEKTRQTLDQNPKDPASFTDLLKGRDDFDFRLTKDNGEKSHVTGYDRLTGKSVTIDGVELLETEFSMVETDENDKIIRQSRGNEYVHPKWRLFLSGHNEWFENGQWFPIDGRPVKIIQPSRPGFASTQPIYECGAVMSSWQPNSGQ